MFVLPFSSTYIFIKKNYDNFLSCPERTFYAVYIFCLPGNPFLCSQDHLLVNLIVCPSFFLNKLAQRFLEACQGEATLAKFSIKKLSLCLWPDLDSKKKDKDRRGQLLVLFGGRT